jgi:hypothetical protein
MGLPGIRVDRFQWSWLLMVAPGLLLLAVRHVLRG